MPHAHPGVRHDPRPFPLPAPTDAEAVLVDADDVTLGGLLFEAPRADRAVLILHGRGEDAADHAPAARAFRDAGFHALSLSMRGARGSGGTNDYGLRQPDDVCAALAHLRARTGARRAFLYGFSQGGFVSLLALARGAQVRAAATLNAPGDMRTFARDTAVPAVRRFVEDANRDGRWRERSPLCHADRVRVPVLLCVSADDVHVPPSEGRRLLERLPRAAWREVPGAGHRLDEAQARPVWADVARFFDANG